MSEKEHTVWIRPKNYPLLGYWLVTKIPTGDAREYIPVPVTKELYDWITIKMQDTLLTNEDDDIVPDNLKKQFISVFSQHPVLMAVPKSSRDTILPEKEYAVTDLPESLREELVRETGVSDLRKAKVSLHYKIPGKYPIKLKVGESWESLPTYECAGGLKDGDVWYGLPDKLVKEVAFWLEM